MRSYGREYGQRRQRAEVGRRRARGAHGPDVRTLRHYDEIGLLVPCERSGAGHRRYTSANLQRLYEILALRQLGLPLAEVAGVLDNPHDPRTVVRRQLEHLERSIDAAQRQRRALQALLGTLETQTELGVHALTKLIKETIAMKNCLTPEQLGKLTEGRRCMTEQMTAEHFAELAQRREVAFAQLPSEEREAIAATARCWTQTTTMLNADVRSRIGGFWRLSQQ